MLYAAGAWTALALAASFLPTLGGVWVAVGVILAATALADAVDASRRAPLEVERRAPTSMALGAWTELTLVVKNSGARRERVAVFDHYPDRTTAEGLPYDIDLPPSSAAEHVYRLRALRRGTARFGPVELLRESPLRLWQRRELPLPPTEIRIYPDFAAIAGFTLHALENRIALMGIRRRQRRGEGFDFRQLRDYQVGDMLRQIDWKATSRRRRPIAREYQEERDQQLVFLLDCGRRMRAIDGDLAYFDHCLNALLLVAYIALRQGDSVSLVTFGGVERRLPPIKGKSSLPTLLNAVYDLDTTLEPSDFIEAATRLKAHQTRRSLVIVLTNQRDEDEEDLRPALELLRRRHLVVLASLRETSVERMLEAPIRGREAALAHCSALGYVQARRASLDRLRGRGVLTLDVVPSRLPAALAEQYLEIKRSGRL